MIPSEWLERVDQLPGDLYRKAVETAREKYAELEARYGRPTALAVMAAGIAGTAVPLPGTTFVAVAPVVALAEVYRTLSQSESLPEGFAALQGQVADSIHTLGRRLVDELSKAVEGLR